MSLKKMSLTGSQVNIFVRQKPLNIGNVTASQCHGWFKLELFMMVTRNLLNSEMTLELSPEILMLNVIQRMHLYHHNSFLDEMINLY